ncbi:MAG: HlyD family efflux transporter periplasmic adaptor subunit [Gemmatimonadota bacterium]
MTVPGRVRLDARRTMGTILAGLVLTLGLTACDGNGDGEIQASGTVEATEADLGFQMAGRIAWVGPRMGDSVQVGEEVARLDQEELLARKRAAEAQREAARALLAEMNTGSRPEEIAEGQAALRGAEERLADAQRDLERARRLFDGGAVSRETLDKAETAARVAESAVDQARERVRLLEEGPRRERIAAQQAMVAQAEATVAQVDAALSNSVVTIPFRGVVTIRHREPGETVSPGAPVLTIMDPEDRWVRIYVREDRVGEVSLGQRATIISDTYGDRTYRGEVIFISSEAEFTPRNVQTTEERVKLVYAVKVQITEDPSHDLKAGIPADVVLEGTGGSGV